MSVVSNRFIPQEIEPAMDYEVEDPPRRRRVGGRGLGFVLVTLALMFVAYSVARILGIEVDEALIVAMALSPYVTAFGIVLGLVCVLTRRRIVGFAVLLLAIGLSALLLPRLLSNGQPEANGERLRIMSINLYKGLADPRTVVRVATEEKIDVLVMPELTDAEAEKLDQQGLSNLLPNRVYEADRSGSGTGVVSRYPLRKITLMPETTLAQPSMVVDVPGNDDVELTAVHLQPGVRSGSAGTWRSEMGRLPRPTPDERVRVLAGDFNASFDHATFRAIVDRGYADAADQAGKGLVPTWSSDPIGIPVTIDHILADNRCALSDYDVYDIPGSDHNALVAQVTLP
jgi:endonuclease/exonuclease/phosphatase (EEP) superfamily protein YafD